MHQIISGAFAEVFPEPVIDWLAALAEDVEASLPALSSEGGGGSTKMEVLLARARVAIAEVGDPVVVRGLDRVEKVTDSASKPAASCATS